MKIQDTIPICPPQLSQYVALAALNEGRDWVHKRVKSLESNRRVLLDALSVLGEESIAASQGAIYLWAKLPGFEDDKAVVVWLLKKHGVCVIPGSSCGAAGHIRIAFANLKPELCCQAAERLKMGLTNLAAIGMEGVRKELLEMDGMVAA